MSKNKTKIGLDKLQQVIEQTCDFLARPVRRSLLTSMVQNVFECGTHAQIDFAIITLLDEGRLVQKDGFVTTPNLGDLLSDVTPTDEGIVKFISCLKEEAKADLFFDPYSDERLTPTMFFKYVGFTYPEALDGQTTALSFMEWFEYEFFHGELVNSFYAEMNDYPFNGGGFITDFFDDRDRRLIVTNMESTRRDINITLLLLPGRRNSYRKSHEQYKVFKENITGYFKGHRTVHIRTVPLSLVTGNEKKKRKNRR